MIGPMAAIYLIVAKLPSFEKFLKHFFPKNHQIVDYIIPILFAIAILGNYIVAVSNPEKKFERAKKARKRHLQSVAKAFIDKLNSKGYSVRLNVMRPIRYPWVLRLLPNKSGIGKISFFPRIFKCSWTSSSSYFISKKFRLGIYQGTSGKAYQDEKQSNFINLDGDYQKARKELKLNFKQWEQTQHLNLLISEPIKSLDNDGKIIGILTLESSNETLAEMFAINPETISNGEFRERIIDVRADIAVIIREMANAHSECHF